MRELTSSPDHVPALDGIRGLAILMVLFYHGSYVVSLEHPIGIFLQKVMNCGWIGVDLFFVLSGFLITRILIRCRGQWKNISNFYVRRALRILPIYYGFIGVMFIGIPLFFDPRHIPGYYYLFKHQIYFWLYIHNWLFANFGRLSSFPYVQHLWSLALEEQYYLLWPAAVFLLSDKSLKGLCALIIGGCLALRIFWHFHGASWVTLQVHTFTRFDSIAFGSLTALLTQDSSQLSTWTYRLKKFFLPLTVLCCGLLLAQQDSATSPWVQTIGYTLLGLDFSLLVLISYFLSHNQTKTLFDARFLRLFGKYSYGIYLYHWPIYLLFNEVYVRYPSFFSRLIPSLGLTLNLAAGIGFSLGAALLSWHTVEKYFLRLKGRFPAIRANIGPE